MIHKFILKIFEVLKDTVLFIQILVLIGIMLLLLYWIQNLIGGHWMWLSFIAPFLQAFVTAGEKISDASVMLFDANFEFKYFIATIFMVIIYYVVFLIGKMISFCEQLYCDGRRSVKKIHEAVFNKGLEQNVRRIQTKTDKYQIYVATQLKKDYVNNYNEINISEENKKMNKFLIEKTGIVPSVIRNGFIYSFNNFEQIDSILEVFFKLLEMRTPLDFCICVYLLENEREMKHYSLEKLADINIKNKIITLPNLVLRYSYNKERKYELSIVGVFQKDNETFEVHQFVEKV